MTIAIFGIHPCIPPICPDRNLMGTIFAIRIFRELEMLGLSGAILKVTSPWEYRRKNTDTCMKVRESEGREENFPVKWDASTLEIGLYEVLGLMHVSVKNAKEEKTIARQKIVEVTVKSAP